MEYATFLLDHNCDVNSVIQYFVKDAVPVKVTPLDRAALHGRLDMVQFLLNAGGASGSQENRATTGQLQSPTNVDIGQSRISFGVTRGLYARSAGALCRIVWTKVIWPRGKQE